MIDFASKMTKDQARALLRRAGLLNKMRVIEGAEREKTLTMLRLVPFESSNNQHLWTQSWQKHYIYLRVYFPVPEKLTVFPGENENQENENKEIEENAIVADQKSKTKQELINELLKK
jgi:hypothetical protein